MPNRLPAESRPLLEDPPCFLVAMPLNVMVAVVGCRQGAFIAAARSRPKDAILLSLLLVLG